MIDYNGRAFEGKLIDAPHCTIRRIQCRLGWVDEMCEGIRLRSRHRRPCDIEQIVEAWKARMDVWEEVEICRVAEVTTSRTRYTRP